MHKCYRLHCPHCPEATTPRLVDHAQSHALLQCPDCGYIVGKPDEYCTTDDAYYERQFLEWLIFWSVRRNMCSMSRGAELLGLSYLQDMRIWLANYYQTHYYREYNHVRS